MKGTYRRLTAALMAVFLLLLCACSTPGSSSSSAVGSSSAAGSSSAGSSSQGSSSAAESTPGPTETPAPPPSSSPEPTATPVPTPPSSTPPVFSAADPTPPPSSPEEENRGEELSPIEKVVEEATDKRHLQLSETPLTSEDSASRYFYDMVAENYVDFGVFVSKPVFAHTAEEYAELFPGLDSISMTGATVYSNGYYFRFKVSRNINFALKTALFTGNTAYLTEAEQQACSNLYSVLDNCTSAAMSDVEKVLAIHNYIVSHTAYGAGANAYDAVGVLVDHVAVCDGYSKAFQLFMDVLEIPCVRFTGTAGGMSHAWNAVQLGGAWYHVDVTWDDPTPDTPDRISYQYFLVTDDIMRQDHNWSYAPVTCTDTSMLLYPYAGCTGETMEDLTGVYTAQVQNGYSYITLVYPTGLAADEDIVRHMGANSYYPSFTRGHWSVLVIRH